MNPEFTLRTSKYGIIAVKVATKACSTTRMQIGLTNGLPISHSCDILRILLLSLNFPILSMLHVPLLHNTKLSVVIKLEKVLHLIFVQEYLLILVEGTN